MKKVLVILVALFVVACCSSCLVTLGVLGSSGEESVANGETPSQVKEDTKVAKKIGDTVSVDDVEFTVTDVTNTTRIGSEYLGANTENNFVIVTVKVKNATSKEISVTSNWVTYLQNGAEYDADSAGAYLGESGFYAIETLGAGITKTIKFVFETPSKSSANDFISVSTGMFGDSVKITSK